MSQNPQTPPPFSQKDFGDLIRFLDDCQVKGSEAQNFLELKGRFANWMIWTFDQEQRKQIQAMEMIEKLKEKKVENNNTDPSIEALKVPLAAIEVEKEIELPINEMPEKKNKKD